MKPKVFVGSSTEGLPLADAVHANLERSAEVTVWRQGVFKLSVTAIESLVGALSDKDFAIFVFSPDDKITIRDEHSYAVRDNVLIELGLFLGQLGRERCFILAPQDPLNLHLPTDLIGITPATYDSRRSDDNLLAATGPACSAIAEHIRKLGFRRAPNQEGTSERADNRADPVPQMDADSQQDTSTEQQWRKALYEEKDYEKAQQLIEARLAEAPASRDAHESLWLEVGLGQVKWHLNPEEVPAHFRGVIQRYPEEDEGYVFLASFYEVQVQFENAIEVLEEGMEKCERGLHLLVLLVGALRKGRGDDAAIEFLLARAKSNPTSQPCYSLLSEIYAEKGDEGTAIAILEVGIDLIPDAKALLKKYADLVAKVDKGLALNAYNRALALDPKSSDVLALRANIYLDLGLYDLALEGYKAAYEITEGQEGWIVANIANIMSVRGFFTNAVERFHEALEIHEDNPYSHERLGTALKERSDEQERLRKTEQEAEILRARRRTGQQYREIQDLLNPTRE